MHLILLSPHLFSADMVAMQDTQDPITTNSSLTEPPTSPVIHVIHNHQEDQTTAKGKLNSIVYWK